MLNALIYLSADGTVNFFQCFAVDGLMGRLMSSTYPFKLPGDICE